MLGLLFFIGFAFFAVWLITFPIRLLFRLVFGLGGVLLRLLLAPVFMVLAVVGVAIAIVVGLLALLAPLVPFALLGLVGWGIYRVTRHRGPQPI